MKKKKFCRTRTGSRKREQCKHHLQQRKGKLKTIRNKSYSFLFLKVQSPPEPKDHTINRETWTEDRSSVSFVGKLASLFNFFLFDTLMRELYIGTVLGGNGANTRLVIALSLRTLHLTPLSHSLLTDCYSYSL